MRIVKAAREGSPVVSLRANGGSLVVSLRASETSEALRRAFACSGQVSLSLSKDEAIFFRLLQPTYRRLRNDGRRNLFVLLAMRLLMAFLFVIFLFLPLEVQAQTTPYQYDWPTLAHDNKRSGATAIGPDGPYTKVWYRDFLSEKGEQINLGYQPIIVKDQNTGHTNPDGSQIDLVLMGTEHGVMYALNLATGVEYWKYPASGKIGGILSSPTFDNNVLYFGSLDGRVYALNVSAVSNNTVSPKWIFDTKRIGGFWATPVVTENSVYIGGRDGYFYAIDKELGTLRWEQEIGASVLTSPAFDGSTLYFGAENMKAYAYSTSGTRVWESAQMAGKSMRGFYPVLTNNQVIFRTSPNDEGHAILAEGETLLAYAAGCTDYPRGVAHYDRADGSIPCFNWKAAASSQADYDREDQFIRNYLSGQSYTAAGQTILGRPQYESFYVLNKSDGRKPYVAPVLWTAQNGSIGAPPVVDTSGRLWVIYRSYYSDWDNPSWFIMNSFGQMNPATGNITLFNPSATLNRCTSTTCNDWFSTQVYTIGDETITFSSAGNKLLTSHWSGIGSVDLSNGRLEKVIGERDYYPRTLNDGNLRSYLFGFSPNPQYSLNEASAPPVFGDRIITHNSSIVAMVQGHLPGTTPTPIPTLSPQPLPSFTPTLAETVVIPSQSELEKYIWEVPQINNLGSQASDLVNQLTAEVSPMVGSTGRLAPWIFIPGKEVLKGYFFEPTLTAYTLSLAYPYLNTTLQSQIRQFITADWAIRNPLASHMDYTQQYQWDEGLTYANGTVLIDPFKQRIPFAPGPVQFCSLKGPINGQPCEGFTWNNLINTVPIRRSFDRLYDLWSYAYKSADWSFIESHWGSSGGIKDIKSQLNLDTANDSSLLGLPTSKSGGASRYDSANRRLSALIAYARIAAHMNDSSEVAWAVDTATKTMQARLRYINTFRPNDGDGQHTSCNPWIDPPDCQPSTWLAENTAGDFIQAFSFSNNIPQMREMVPEVGRLLANYAQSDLIRYNNYMDTALPALYLSQGGNPIPGEIMYFNPDNIQSLFYLKTLAGPTKLSGDQLRKYLDIPWVKQDYFYWERLVRTIEAYGTTFWCDVRTGNCTAASLAGDVNSDTQVNVLDIQACVNHILGIQDLGSRGDVNGDGSVNVLDVQNIVNIILGV